MVAMPLLNEWVSYPFYFVKLAVRRSSSSRLARSKRRNDGTAIRSDGLKRAQCSSTGQGRGMQRGLGPLAKVVVSDSTHLAACGFAGCWVGCGGAFGGRGGRWRGRPPAGRLVRARACPAVRGLAGCPLPCGRAAGRAPRLPCALRPAPGGWVGCGGAAGGRVGRWCALRRAGWSGPAPAGRGSSWAWSCRSSLGPYAASSLRVSRRLKSMRVKWACAPGP